LAAAPPMRSSGIARRRGCTVMRTWRTSERAIFHASESRSANRSATQLAETGRQEQIERAGFLAEHADLNRLDPLAVELRAEILLRPWLMSCPMCRQIECLLVLDHRAITSLLHLQRLCCLYSCTRSSSGYTIGTSEIVHFHASLPSFPLLHHHPRRRQNFPVAGAQPAHPAINHAMFVTPLRRWFC